MPEYARGDSGGKGLEVLGLGTIEGNTVTVPET
jgi:hypothetical protein